jgi:hypothetical protein
MERRRGRWVTVVAVIGALLVAGAIYEAWRTPTPADAQMTIEQRRVAEEASSTAVGMWTPEMWAEQEDMLRTDEDAQVYARNFTILLRAIVPVSDPAVFSENATFVKVSPVRGTGAASVWEASYNITVDSNETTFTTVYPTTTRFGPGLTPADSPPRGIEDVFAFADLQYFSKDQRVAFLRYCNANRLKDLHIVARLDREYPGAPWYEDSAFRTALLAAGKKAGLGPSDLAYYFLDHKLAGTLVGYDADTQTWRQLKVGPYNYAKWYAAKAAAAAKVAAAAAAKAGAPAKQTAKARSTAKAKTSAKQAAKAGRTAQATPPAKQGAAAGGTAQATPPAKQPVTAGGTAQATPPAKQPVTAGGTIPATGTPWYNVLLVGAALLLLGAAGLVRYASRRHS